MIQITDIKVNVLEGKGKMLATGNITFAGVMAVSGFKLIDKNGDGKHLFISYPSIKQNNGQFAELVKPTTKDFRNYIAKCFIAKYEEAKRDKDIFTLPTENKLKFYKIDGEAQC
jgi:DNA-binding cell septation regulator SpoVG